jgi:flavin-dependent dehydrogenase
VLLDQAVFPRVKLCAGWVTPEALADAEVDPEKYPATIQPFDACRFEFDGVRHETRWRRPASYGILRREFDHFLLDRARATGAEVRDGTRVATVTVDADQAHVMTDKGPITAKVVVGAGGHRCPVAHALGEVSEQEEVVIAQESETAMPSAMIAILGEAWRAPELYVEPDLRGYGWYFPKGDVLNVGIGCVAGPSADLPGRRKALLDRLRASGRLPDEVMLDPFKGHAYVVRRRAPRRLAGARFCLVGDAAGLARDLSGEGIGPAIRSGLLAADAIEAYLRRGASLVAYEHAIVNRYGSGETGWVGRQLARVPDRWTRGLVRTVLRLGPTRRHVVLGRIFGMREVPQ